MHQQTEARGGGAFKLDVRLAGMGATMRVGCAALALCVLAACAPRGEAGRTSSGVEEGAFAYVTGEQVLTVVDRYQRRPGLLEGEITTQIPGASFRRVRYRVELGADGRARRAELRFLRADSARDGAPLARVETTFESDGRVRETRDGGPAAEHVASVGAVPFFAPSIAMLQEIVREAHRRTGGRGSAEVPFFPLATGGQGIGTATVTWTSGDSVEVSLRGARGARYAVDGRGRIMGGRGADGSRTRRLPHAGDRPE